MAGAAIISGGLRVLAQTLTWLMTLGTVRLLTPDDYGLAGLAMTCLTMPSILIDLGMGPAIQSMAQQERRTQAEAHTLVVAIGGTVAMVVATLSFPLADFFGRPELQLLLLVAAFGILLEALRAIPTAVALRSFQFALVARTDFLRSMVGGTATIGLAWQGAGAWSIVVGAVAANLLSLLPLLRAVGIPLCWPRRSSLTPLVQYGRLMLIGRTTWQAWANADTLTLGRMMSVTAVGHFAVAKTFAMLPQEKLLSVLMGITTSFFADRASDREALKAYLLELTELIALGMGLPLLGLLLVSHDLFPLLLGDHWTESAGLLPLLIPAAFLSCIGVLANQIITVRGRASIATWGSTVAAIIAFPLFAAGIWLGGVAGLAAGSIVISIVINVPGIIDVLQETSTTPREYARAFLPACWSGAAVIVTVTGVRALLATLPESPGPVVLTASLITSGAVAGMGTMFLCGGPGVQHLRRAIRARHLRHHQPLS
jgi:PST family polysaccharide transporter